MFEWQGLFLPSAEKSEGRERQEEKPAPGLNRRRVHVSWPLGCLGYHYISSKTSKPGRLEMDLTPSFRPTLPFLLFCFPPWLEPEGVPTSHSTLLREPRLHPSLTIRQLASAGASDRSLLSLYNDYKGAKGNGRTLAPLVLILISHSLYFSDHVRT